MLLPSYMLRHYRHMFFNAGPVQSTRHSGPSLTDTHTLIYIHTHTLTLSCTSHMSSYDQGRGSAIRQEAVLILRDRNSPCCSHVCRVRGTYMQENTVLHVRTMVDVPSQWGGGSHTGARPKINAPGCRAQQHTLARRAAGIVSTCQQRLQSARIVDIRLNDIYDRSVFTVQHASHYGAGSRGQRGYLPLAKSPCERGNKSSQSQVIVR